MSRRIICLCILALAPALRGFADAIVVTRAMTATTIAEVSIEEASVRLELEIGLPDLGGFRRDIAGIDRAPFGEDFVLRADGGEPIAGELRRLEPRQRVRRDEITGEPLPAVGAEQEIVVYAELVYPLALCP